MDQFPKDNPTLQGIMTQDLSEQRQLGPDVLHNMLAVVCYCGLSRLIMQKLGVGDRINLPPCPGCGAYYTGKYTGTGVQLD